MTTSTPGFLTNLITVVVVFLLFLALFLVLSGKPSLAVIYYSRRILTGSGPPKSKTRGRFQWLTDAFRISDLELAKKAGLDALAYITLFKTGLKIFVGAFLYCVCIELPVNVTGNSYQDYNQQPGVAGNQNRMVRYSGFDELSMGNVKRGSPRLWTHVVAAYWVSLVCYYVLYTSYRSLAKVRADFLNSFGGRAKVRQYAVLVTDIPSTGDRTDRHTQVDAYFHKLHPGAFERAQVITKLSKVDKTYQEKEKVRRKLAHAAAVLAEAQEKNGAHATRPQHRTGFLGMGKKVDTIEWCQKRLTELNPELADEQRRTASERTIDAALCFFNSRTSATMAAQTVHGLKAEAWQTQHAPEPRDIIWSHLGVSWSERFMRQSIVYGVTAVIILFYMIPITVVSAFSTLDNLRDFAPFLDPVFDIPVVKAILQAFLPQLALLIFMAILPKLLLFLTRMEGLHTQSHTDRGCAGKFYLFEVFNVFLGVSIAGTAFGQLKQMIENPTGIVDLLGSSIPQQATFFITYIALRGFVGYGLDLSQIIRVITYTLKKKKAKTEEEKRAAWSPGGFDYFKSVPVDLLIVLLGLCYAVIAPIIIPFCFVYLGLGYVINKNLALEVKYPDYESGGRMYPHIHKRFVASLFVAQLTLIGYMGVLKFTPTPVLAPLPILTVIFYLFTKKSLEPRFTSTAMEVAIQEVSEEPSIQEVTAAYTPECMQGGDELDVEAFPANLKQEPAITSTGDDHVAYVVDLEKRTVPAASTTL